LAASLWVLKFNRHQFAPLVKRGEKINPGQAIGVQRRKVSRSINLARRLKIKPDKIKSCLLVAPGTVVEKGDKLAERHRIAGRHLAVTAPCRGRFVLAAKRAGWVKIIRLGKRKIRALLAGEVAAIRDDRLAIRFMARVFPGEIDYRRQQWGELMLLDPPDLFSLHKPAKPAFLLVAKPNLALATKAWALGIKAIISGTLLASCPLPNFVVDDYNALLPLAGQPALLDGKRQRLLVCQKYYEMQL